MRPAVGRSREAPEHQIATCSAVMAAFIHLALSAGSLGASYLNGLFLVARGS